MALNPGMNAIAATINQSHQKQCRGIAQAEFQKHDSIIALRRNAGYWNDLSV
jgi:hypothetical protein